MSNNDLDNNLIYDFKFTSKEIYEDNFLDKLRTKENYTDIISKYSKKIRLTFFIRFKKFINYKENIIFEDFDEEYLYRIYNSNFF